MEVSCQIDCDAYPLRETEHKSCYILFNQLLEQTDHSIYCFYIFTLIHRFIQLYTELYTMITYTTISTNMMILPENNMWCTTIQAVMLRCECEENKNMPTNYCYWTSVWSWSTLLTDQTTQYSFILFCIYYITLSFDCVILLPFIINVIVFLYFVCDTRKLTKYEKM